MQPRIMIINSSKKHIMFQNCLNLDLLEQFTDNLNTHVYYFACTNNNKMNTRSITQKYMKIVSMYLVKRDLCFKNVSNLNKFVFI